MSNNPFSRRAAEQMGGVEIIESDWLEYVTGEEYDERVKNLFARGKLVEQTEEDKLSIQTGSWRRAGGGCVCDKCGKTYQDHPIVHKYAILHKLCDGRLVKL